MVNRGGGVFDFRCKKLFIPEKYRFVKSSTHMLIFEFLVNVCDSMGANLVNTIAEGIAPFLAGITNSRTGLKILSNLSSDRRTISFFRIPVEKMAYKNYTGKEVSEKILEAYLFAKLDPYRATTHNKGIMNGIDAVAIATGQDWRAIEAGAHAYHSSKNNSGSYNMNGNDRQQSSNYSPLTTYEIKHVNGIEYFCGYLEIPIAVGARGGATNSNPAYRNNLLMLGKPNAKTLSQIMTSVGLSQNFAALRALAIEGIQKGHMT